MLRFIEEHATIGFKVEEVATETGLSVSRAVHLFKETTGKTNEECLNKQGCVGRERYHPHR